MLVLFLGKRIPYCEFQSCNDKKHIQSPLANPLPITRSQIPSLRKIQAKKEEKENKGKLRSSFHRVYSLFHFTDNESQEFFPRFEKSDYEADLNEKTLLRANSLQMKQPSKNRPTIEFRGTVAVDTINTLMAT